MRKLLLPLFSVLALGVQAQTTFFTENFESGTFPAGWTQTTLATDGGWLYGNDNTLSSSYFTIPSHTQFVATNDDACYCDKSNDLLKTPVINLSAASQAVFLKADVCFNGTNFDEEKGTIEISTDGGTTWTVLKSISPVRASWGTPWQPLMLDLTAYAGNANVMIGFRYNDAGLWGYGMGIDNVQIYQPVAIDADVFAVDVPSYVSMGPTNITGKLVNLGSTTITSLDLNYQPWGSTASPIATQTITSLNIAPFDTFYFTHPIPWIPAVTEVYGIDVWATNINGQNDQNTSNDAEGKMVSVGQNLPQRQVLVESYTNASCDTCARHDSLLYSLVTSGNNPSKVVPVFYHTYYSGTDPMYSFNTTEPDGMWAAAYIDYSIPYSIVDVFGYRGRPAKLTQQVIDNRYNQPAPFSINCTASITGNTMTITGSTTCHALLTQGNAKMQVMVVEDSITYATAPGTNGATFFPRVVRKMLPNQNGTGLGVSAIGDVDNFSFTYTIPSQVDANHLSVVVYVQNSADILQVVNITPSLITGIEEQNASVMNIYPNPTEGDAILEFSLFNPGHVTVTVLNMLGEQVMNTDKGIMAAGKHSVMLSTADLAAGVYYVQLNEGANRVIQKISVAK